jgi:hypothetical protein
LIQNSISKNFHSAGIVFHRHLFFDIYFFRGSIFSNPDGFFFWKNNLPYVLNHYALTLIKASSFTVSTALLFPAQLAFLIITLFRSGPFNQNP